MSTNRSNNTHRHYAAMLMIACSFLGMLISPAVGQSEVLSTERWSEQAHGISLLPPVNSRMVKHVGQESLVRCVHDLGFAFEVFVRRSRDGEAIRLNTLIQDTIKQMYKVNPSQSVVKPRDMRVSGLPAALIYFSSPNKQGRRWVTGQFLMLIEANTVVNIVFDTPMDRWEQAQPIFEAVLDSIKVENPDVIKNRQADNLARGFEWRKKNKPKDLLENLVREQWYRLISPKNEDIGYMVIRMRHGRLDPRVKTNEAVVAMPGLQVDVQTRLWFGEMAVDSLSNFFVTEDGREEIWSIKTAKRTEEPDKIRSIRRHKDGRAGGDIFLDEDFTKDSTAETWVRTRDGKIVLHRRMQGGDQTKVIQWQTPPNFVSQAELYVLGPSIPTDGQPIAFYAYHANEGRITIRRETATRQNDGTTLVRSLLTQDTDVEQISTYRPGGNLIERIYPGGMSMKPATIAELSAIRKFKR